MRVSTYFAATLPEAMAKVKDALGPKAVVLSWRNVRGGIEISASVQSPEAGPPAAPVTRQREESLADHFAPDELAFNQSRARERPITRPAPRPLTNMSQPRGMGALINRTAASPVRPAASVNERRPAPPQARAPRMEERHLEREMPAPLVAEAPRSTTETSRLNAFLMRAGLTAKQALIFGASYIPELRRALTESLSKALRFEPIEAIPSKPILLVGPPGAGKSACAAKLATRTLSAGHEVLLVSADAERCGGSDQLAALAKRLDARFETVTTLVDLSQLVTEARQRGMVVFVDAPSACPAQPADMRAMRRMIEETRLEPVLCLPADMRADDMEELALAYAEMGVKRAVATRMDLTTRRASVLHVLQVANIALAQISATPYISGGVALATAPRVTSLLLEPFEDALAEDAA